MAPRFNELDSCFDEKLIYDDGLVKVYVMIDYVEDMEIELSAKPGYNPITMYEAVRDNGNFIGYILKINKGDMLEKMVANASVKV